MAEAEEREKRRNDAAERVRLWRKGRLQVSREKVRLGAERERRKGEGQGEGRGDLPEPRQRRLRVVRPDLGGAVVVEGVGRRAAVRDGRLGGGG